MVKEVQMKLFIKRRKTRKIRVGSVMVGGTAPVSVQSMLKTPFSNTKGLLGEVKSLEEAGCQILRIAIPDLKAIGAISKIKKISKLPLVADIHFNYRLAIAAIQAGIEKVRLNPGNIRRPEETSTTYA